MKKTISLSQIGLYNPQRQSAELSEELFVARKKEFNELMDFLNEEEPDSVPQHHLIIAARGMGKTTLLKRIEIELHKKQYRRRFIPLLLPEEQYNLIDLTELWLNCLDELLDSLETENEIKKNKIEKIEKEIEKIKKEYKNSSDICKKLYSYLMSVCKQMKRRPVLLMDNIGFAFRRLSKTEQNLLRGYLSEKSCPILIGAGVSMAGVLETKEHIINYKAPFYDFFQTHYLKNLELNELIEILYKLSELTRIKISINTENRVYLQSLFRLTGGNPRTVVMLFKLLVKGFSKSIVDDLEALLDESTPLNKARFEELPTQQQIILNAIAQNLDPINLFDLSEATRYKNNQLSPQLNRLISAGWITTTIADKREWTETAKKSKENTIKGNAYSISERFMAIWLIMRNGSRKMKNEIRKVLESYEWIYGSAKALDTTGTPKDVYYLEKALFELHKRNEGIASNYLGKALKEIEDNLNPKTQSNWEYFAATTIKLGYAKWLLDILSEKGFDTILSPFYVAIQALEIERTNKSETMEIYLRNQAPEKSEPARLIIERIK